MICSPRLKRLIDPFEQVTSFFIHHFVGSAPQDTFYSRLHGEKGYIISHRVQIKAYFTYSNSNINNLHGDVFQ